MGDNARAQRHPAGGRLQRHRRSPTPDNRFSSTRSRSREMSRSLPAAGPLRCRGCRFWRCSARLPAAARLHQAGQSPSPRSASRTSRAAFPRPTFRNSDSAPLTVEDGKLRLSMAQLVAAVVENNLTVASARYYPSIAQTDLLRARSGASPRGVDASVIPSGVFSGAEGGSILGTAGGRRRRLVQPRRYHRFRRPRQHLALPDVFDPTVSFSFSMDHTASPLNSLVVAGVPSVTTSTVAFSVELRAGLLHRHQLHPFLRTPAPGLHATASALRPGHSPPASPPPSASSCSTASAST